MKKILKIISTTISALLIITAISILAAVVPFFGNRSLIVRSGSMEPAIGVGDLTIVRPKQNYQSGDIIAYKSDSQRDVVVTHRIVGIEQTGASPILTTQGDANEQPDANKVMGNQIIGRQILTIPHLGKLLAFGKTKGGFLTFILIPGLLVIFSEARVIFKEISAGKRQKLEPKTQPAPLVVNFPSKKKISKPTSHKTAIKPTPAFVYTHHSPNTIVIPKIRKTTLRHRAPKPIDSLTRKLVVNPARYVLIVALLAIMIPSTFATYSDSEKSVNNIFQAASCFDTDPYADSVLAVSGTYGHCCNQSDLASDIATAEPFVLGAPDSPPDLDFIQISDNSSITVQFNNNKGMLSEDATPDLRIYTYDDLFPGDAEIFVSDNCIDFTSVGIFSDSNAPDNYIDIDIDGSGITNIKCVRIEDLVAEGDIYPTLGFDLDAVESLNSIIQCGNEESVPPIPTPSSSPSPLPSPSPNPSPSPLVSPSPPPVSVGNVIINEVMWMGSTKHSGDEWIELRNLTNNEVSVEEWTINNAGAGNSDIQLTGTIPANGFYLISNFQPDNPQSELNDIITVDKTANLSLLNDGEQLILRDTLDNIIDSTPTGSWPAGVNITGGNPLKQSMSRNNPPANGTVASNWYTCTDQACNDTTWWDSEGNNYGTPVGINL